MSFVRPTIEQLVTRIQADFVSRLTLVSPILRRAMVYVLSRVVAGAAHGLHGHIEWKAKQTRPDTADRADLLRIGGNFGVTLNEAAFATGNVVLTGTNLTVVDEGTVLVHADGSEYTTDTAATIVTLSARANTTAYVAGNLRTSSGKIYECITAGASGGAGDAPTTTATDITDGTVHWRYVAAGSAAVTVAVTASLAGEDGSRLVDVPLSYQSPVAGADAAVMVATGGLTGGADEEDIEDYRARVLARMQSPPHGGNAADYEAWCLEVSGVTRAWCYPLEGGAGTVTVRFMRDDDTGSAIPSAGEVTTVQAYLDGLQAGTVESPIGGGPEVTAAITVAAPVAAPLNFTLSIMPDTAATRAAVTAELADMILRDAEPRGTLGTPTGIILLSHVHEAIGRAAGVTDYTLTAPAANTTPAGGSICTLGSVTFS